MGLVVPAMDSVEEEAINNDEEEIFSEPAIVAFRFNNEEDEEDSRSGMKVAAPFGEVKIELKLWLWGIDVEEAFKAKYSSSLSSLLLCLVVEDDEEVEVVEVEVEAMAVSLLSVLMTTSLAAWQEDEELGEGKAWFKGGEGRPLGFAMAGSKLNTFEFNGGELYLSRIKAIPIPLLLLLGDSSDGLLLLLLLLQLTTTGPAVIPPLLLVSILTTTLLMNFDY